MFGFEQQLYRIILTTARTEAAKEDVERKEEAGPGSAEPAAEERSRELKTKITNVTIYKAVLTVIS